MQNANDLLCELPTVRREAKGHLKFLFEDLQSLCLFRTTHHLLRKAHATLRSHFLAIPRPATTKKKKKPPPLAHFSHDVH